MTTKIEIKPQIFKVGGPQFDAFRVHYFDEKGLETRSEPLIEEADIWNILGTIEEKLRDALNTLQK